MAEKVTDPEILSALDEDGGRVRDPGLIAELEAEPNAAGAGGGSAAPARLTIGPGLTDWTPEGVERGKDALTAAARGATQIATLGHGDEMAGGIDAVAARVNQWAREHAPALVPDAPTGSELRTGGTGPKTVGERYTTARDFYRGLNQQTEAQAPVPYHLGEVGMGLAMAPKTLLGALLQGGAQGLGTSEAPTVKGMAADTAVGAGINAAGYGIGKGAGYLLDLAGTRLGLKQGEAIGEAAIKAKAKGEEALHGEISALGGETQNANRQVENVIRLLDEEKTGALDPAKRLALESMRGSAAYKAAVDRIADRAMETLPGSAARVTRQEGVVGAMRAALPQSISDSTAASVSGAEAKRQIKDRAIRYGLPAVGGWVGQQLGLGDEAIRAMGGESGAKGEGDDEGGGYLGRLGGFAIGGLAGASLRPMMHSLKHLAQNPAVRNQIYGALQRALATAKPGAASIATAGAKIITASRHPAESGANEKEESP